MKFLIPVFYYILFFTIFIFILFFISMGSLTNTLGYFTEFYIYFNILFITIFYYLNNNISKIKMSFVSITALLLTLLFCEIIYPNVLKENIVLNNINNNYIEKNASEVVKVETEEFKPSSDLEFAEFYFEKNEYSTAWFYADKASEKYPIESEIIKKLAQEALNLKGFSKANPKYIETLKYKNLIQQKRYLEAYYFCLDKIENAVYDHDFNIKLTNCFTILINDYYSINNVENVLNNPGYSDIQFFEYEGNLKHYKIEKLVEFEGEYYLQNIKINDDFYPYIFIDRNGKVFSKGFNEEKDFTYIYDSPVIPMDPDKLKLFSKEMYKLSASSLHFNISVFLLKNTFYFKESHLANLIISRFTSYSSILIIFFLVYLKINKQNYLNFLFSYSIVLFSFKWFVKQIGLILINYGLGLSFTVVSIFYSIFFIILLTKNKRLI